MLPTMIILAVYYTLADIVLLGQIFYYRGFTLSDEVKKTGEEEGDAETEPLLRSNGPDITQERNRTRSCSLSQLRRRLSSVDGTHLSPATPLLSAPNTNEPPAIQSIKPTTTLQAIASNTFAIILVCAAGVFGWWISSHSGKARYVKDESPNFPEFDVLGQVFGYLCAVFYLGSRVPQLLLNYRRKSTEGLSLLFFLFACIGNLTYVMSIFAYSPICYQPHHCTVGEARSIYGRYILVNASWIIGSFGTLLLDTGAFVQFFLYKKPDLEDDADAPSAPIDERGRNQDVR